MKVPNGCPAQAEATQLDSPCNRRAVSCFDGRGLAWSCWVYVQIENYAGLDQTAPSDAICVLGAAEYDGRPSPVFRARLDHALDLQTRHRAAHHHFGWYHKDEYSEGAVGREYLVSLECPAKCNYSRNRKPKHRRTGAQDCHHRSSQQDAPPGRRQRWHPRFSDTPRSAPPTAQRAHFTPNARLYRWRRRGGSAHCARNSQLHRMAASHSG